MIWKSFHVIAAFFAVFQIWETYEICENAVQKSGTKSIDEDEASNNEKEKQSAKKCIPMQSSFLSYES